MKKNIIVIMFISVLYVNKVSAQIYPPDSHSFDNGSMPVQTMPDYKQFITDATFGTIITRVADKAAFGSTNNVNGHEYSTMEAWNCNSTLLILKYGNYPEMVIDGNNYNIIGRHTTPRGSTWSNTQAYIMYGVSGNNFVKYDISTKKTTVLREFNEYSSLDYLGENHISIDDKYTCIFGYKGDSLHLISFDIANNVIIAEKYLGKLAIGDNNPNGVNAIQMSQKGNYILVIYKSAGNGPAQGVHLYDRNLNYVRFLQTQSGHCDMGMDADGNELYVGQDGQAGRAIITRRLSDNVSTVVLSESKSSFAQHLSCRNFKRPGWCYMSEYAETYDQNRPMTNKLFALKLDGSETVEFFGWSRRSNVVDYNRCQFICPNPDGSKVVFRSDWGNAASDAMVNDYVATYGTVGIDTIAPSAPAGLNTANMDRTSCTLSWTASTDNIAVTNYEIFMGNVSVGKTNLTSFDVSGLKCGADNSLTVKATDASGNWSVASEVKTATTIACDIDAPSVPANVVASEIGSTFCKLTWTASTDNVMVIEYYIYSDGIKVGQTSELSFAISSLNCGSTNSITIAAVDANKNMSLPSTPISVTTLDCKVNIALNKTVTYSTQESTNTGTMATDGNINTRWAASSGVANNWITVDLGANYNLSGAEILWEQTSWIYKYKIEVSEDKKSWTMALDKTTNTYSGQTETVSFDAIGKRYIRLTITGWGNGGFWASLYEFRVYGNITAVGISKISDDEVEIYPNPAKTNITIDNIEPNSKISIFSIDGKLIYSNNSLNGGELRLSVRDWNKGIYLLKLQAGKGLAVRKIIIK